MSKAQAGVYLATVKATGFGESTQKQTPYLQFDVRVTAIRNQEGSWELLDQELDRNVKLWFSDKTAEGSVKRLRSLGWNGTDLGDFEKGVLDGDEIEIVNEGLDDGGYEIWSFPRSGAKPVENNSKVAKLLKNKFAKLLKTQSPGKPLARRSGELQLPRPQLQDQEPDDAGSQDEVPF